MSVVFGKTIEEKSIKLEFDNSRITNIIPIQTSEELPYIASGLCDLQLNGYYGIDFNRSENIVEEDLELLQNIYLEEGCTSFLPTIITNDVGFIGGRLKNIKEIIDKNPKLKQSIIGFHIEGPFISPMEGARGAHVKEFVCAPDAEIVKEWQKLSGGLVKIVTLSPEWENSNQEIQKIADMEICVSIGHTMASAEQITEAVHHGTRMVTHFGNGVPLEIPRHPNFLWQELAEDDLSLGIIADGFHLPNALLKTVLSVKKDQCFLVSDSTSFGGQQPGIYQTHIGGKVLLSAEGRLCLYDNPLLLAGSAQSLRHGVEYLVNNGLASLDRAWNLGSTIPAQKINFKHSLKIGNMADFVLFNYKDQQLIILETYLNGEKYKNTLV